MISNYFYISHRLLLDWETLLLNHHVKLRRYRTMSASYHNPLFVTGSLLLSLAMIACGISFFGPYWLQNVTRPNPSLNSNSESDTSYIHKDSPSTFTNRGLWAQCGSVCQWFWEDGYVLQTNKFSALREYG